jgi:hypothetical protein
VWRIEAYSPAVFHPLNVIRQSDVEHQQAKFQQVACRLILIIPILSNVSGIETR